MVSGRLKSRSKLVEGYQGDPSQLAIDITVKEGPQTRVASVRIEGSYTLPQEQLPEIQTEEGQGFDESSLADDRDTILEKYFDNGFPNATVEVAYVPVPSADNLPRVGVTFSIHEGEQFFVDQVFLDGLHYTRAGVARREMRVQPGRALEPAGYAGEPAPPLRPRTFQAGGHRHPEPGRHRVAQERAGHGARGGTIHLRLRRRFRVPDGAARSRGQPTTGATGVSPMVSLGVTRLNVGGRHQTLTMKANVGRLQQKGLISYDIPKLLNRDNLRFTATALYDNTVDVSTFTSKRLEGTLQVLQVLYKSCDN